MDSIEQTRLYVFSRDNWRCHCGKFIMDGTPQIGHRINQNKIYLKKYGSEIIQHPDNMVSCCSLKCNHAVSLYGKDRLIEELVEQIKNKMAYDAQ